MKELYRFASTRQFFIVLALIACVLVFLSWFTFRASIFSGVCHSSHIIPGESDPKTNGDQLNQLLRLGRHIAKAHRHSRSGIAVKELNQAYQLVNVMLRANYQQWLQESLPTVPADPAVVKPKPSELPDVCDEYMPSMRYGYPWYFHGFILNENCTAKPIENVVSLVINAKNMESTKLTTILNGLKTAYPTVRAVVGVASEGNTRVAENAGMKVVQVSTSDSDGKVWKKLAESAETKYVLIGRDMQRFDNQSNLERMIRMASYFDMDIVGGSYRFGDGRWFRGCYQMGLKNYTLKFVEGYDFAFSSCIYCDYLPGPFLTRPQTFLESIDESLDKEMVFVDFFVKRFQDEKMKQVVCPDVMFNLDYNEMHHIERSTWVPLALKLTLNKVIFTNENSLSFTCAESGSSCAWTGGLALPICCMQELSESTKFLAKVSQEIGGTVELEAGSCIGAVKFYGVIPWERDEDLNWVSGDDEERKLMDRQQEFKNRGYELVPWKTEYAKCSREGGNVNCGYMALRTKNWRLEMWGVFETGSSIMAKDLGIENVTRIMFDGMWIRTNHNPALTVRNQYGDDLFEHLEHWITLGYSTGWVQPPTGKFLECPKPGFHACLDSYLPVGNLQFQDIYV